MLHSVTGSREDGLSSLEGSERVRQENVRRGVSGKTVLEKTRSTC